MLRIRDEQLATLGARAFARFRGAAIRQVADLGVERFDGADEGEVAQWVDSRLDHREIIGVVDDEAVILRWLEVCAIHGDEAGEDDLVLRTLARPEHVEQWVATRAFLDAHFADRDPVPYVASQGDTLPRHDRDGAETTS